MRAPARASAQSAQGVGNEANPWSVGVTLEAKNQARALLTEGNDNFIRDNFTDAITKYLAALAIWDHPAIAFNAVRTLVRLDRNVEAADMLERAMRFQSAPLGAEAFAEAQGYQRLLANLVAKVEVRCAQPTTASFAGNNITCPGSKMFRVQPGKHVLAASQKGFLAINRTELLIGGDNPAIDIKLLSIEAATVTTTRWATWKPWTVAASGTVLLGAALIAEVDTRNTQKLYSDALRASCGKALCTDADVRAGSTASGLNDSWRFKRTVAVTLAAAGGAVLVTGVVMLVLNRPHASIHEKASLAGLKFFVDPVNPGVVAMGEF
jgi:hypothetical protein